MKQGAAGAAALGACLTDVGLPGSVAADSKGKLVRRVEKLTGSIEKKCSGVTEPVFPGECPTAAGEDLSNCASEIARCRACLALNATHGLAEDCDLFDDSAPDASCPGGAVAEETLSIPSDATPPRRPGTPGVSSPTRSCSRSSGAAAST